MRNKGKLIIEQLDQKLKPFMGTEKVQLPSTGWINNIRSALHMTMEQLGNRLNITRQGIKQLEDREVTGAISIKNLKVVAKALDMHFVYGFVPKDGSIENLLEIKARQLAEKIVLRTNHNMKLENQGNSEERIKGAIEELAMDIKREMPKSLWD